ncbi:maleylpyruvate isomerase family mycothiol-dependent enzyme [Cellulomonas carbonis]|uniref:Mycothiol-dependent maleylpyruvate isomerase metal-binding domain-containing protein n=1 Tax=Cellulomonas carbonis T26 TaxID=947969 RepID=A0A0A0BJ67_9CELL|nr:maleylpyruvate isomerase family mycothiol-dependent enzyme [Cellulomonas carbonis]KGM08553.1 hypothetical protein N868_08345 [Cellulomonas carbonis T26]GGC17541.1 hypothetical protein GCM10010972_33550 [Cellulomonas carbonis]
MIEPTHARRLVAGSWQRFAGLLDAGGADLSAPTRLPGWSVGDLVAHTAWGTSMEAEALELAVRRSPGRAAGTPPDPADLRGSWEAGRARLVAALDELAALDAADLPAALPMPYGDVPLTLALHTFVMEAAVHTSDLAHALGQPGGLDDGAVPSTAEFLTSFWDVLAAGATEHAPAGSTLRLRGTSVDVARTYDGGAWAVAPPGSTADVMVTGDDGTVLLFALGRVPLDALDVAGDRQLAARFKQLVPGP